MDAAADRLMGGGDRLGRTDALLVKHDGEVVLERYGPQIDRSTTLRSWSMAKSMLHAAVGLLVDAGRLDPAAPAAVPEWESPDDPRSAITTWDLLRMRPGLAWTEDYVDGESSDVIEMLFSQDWEPVPDTGAFAASKPLVAPPDTVLNYSSGTSNIVSRIVAGVVGAGPQYEKWLRSELFGPLGMDSAEPVFDDVGTWIASSYCFCTARDFARFGELYLNGGEVDGRQLLSAEWVRSASVATGIDEDGRAHTAHWWMWEGADPGAYNCSGYEGQYIIVLPERNAVVVRLGQSPAELRDSVGDELNSLISELGGR